ncbi:MAG: glycosyltransferase 87 family protein [Candidatus Sulfotelmatobacter sp.]
MKEAPSNEPLQQLLATTEWILVLALFGFFFTRAVVPGWRVLNTDFPNYYLTALLRSQHEPLDSVYAWTWFQRQKDHDAISQPLVGFVPNPPLSAAPMLALSSLTALPAKRVWIVVNLAFLVATLLILHNLTELGWRRILLIAGLCLLPLQTNFLLGQYYMVILLLISLAYIAMSRGHHVTAGILLALGAWFKVFPGLFLILFLRKRDWRGVAGLIVGCLAFGAASVLIFGLDAHRVLFFEVLPRAFRGEMAGPYDLQWSSFGSLWHRLFLFEPELNPHPVLNSPAIYALVQASTATILLFTFLFFTSENRDDTAMAWEWAAFIPFLLLLSSMPSSYHYVVLIFAVIVGTDLMIRAGRWRTALLLLFLYAVACSPRPTGGPFFLRRLLATLALYLVLLWNAPAVADSRTRKRLWGMAAAVFVLIVALNVRTLNKRDDDFSRRIPQNKREYASFNPVATSGGVAAIEMLDEGYRGIMVSEGQAISTRAAGDMLSIAASPGSPFVYFELADQSSRIFRIPSDEAGTGAVPEFVAEGQQPAISYDGHWLAFLREHRGRSTIWLSHDGGNPVDMTAGQSWGGVLEVSVTGGGDIVAAVGGAASPHLVEFRQTSGTLTGLRDIEGAVRFPAMSPDSTRLAFSRREFGSWHLFVRSLGTGVETRLTDGACNATKPAWEDFRTVLYATDCGRGYDLNAIARTVLND